MQIKYARSYNVQFHKIRIPRGSLYTINDAIRDNMPVRVLVYCDVRDIKPGQNIPVKVVTLYKRDMHIIDTRYNNDCLVRDMQAKANSTIAKAFIAFSKSDNFEKIHSETVRDIQGDIRGVKLDSAVIRNRCQLKNHRWNRM